MATRLANVLSWARYYRNASDATVLKANRYLTFVLQPGCYNEPAYRRRLECEHRVVARELRRRGLAG